MGLVFLVAATVVVATVGFVIWLVVQLVTSAFVWVLVAPVALGFIAILVMRSTFRTWRPVRSLVGLAGSLADGDYTARAAEPRSGAMKPVVRSFNKLAGRLEDAELQRRRLLADLGHEIRTPLTVVRGEIEAMLDGVHEPDPEHLEALLDEVRVMERLVEDLRTLTLAEAGQLSLHPEATDIDDLVGDVVDSHRPGAERAGVVVRFIPDGSIGEIMVDPVRIREVVANLIVNALRAMPDGGALTVRVSSPAAGRVDIVVADTGIGIPEDELDHIFDRFHKSATSSGSGLGLTISRDLVGGHGGSMYVASEVGAGTTVTVSLPAAVA